jgi:DNA-binding transcriptional ArsR family regulator
MALDGSEQAARLAKALAHPSRIAILDSLRGGATSPARLARVTDASVSNLSYHFRALRKHGFLRLARKLPKRGATEHLYEVTPDAGALRCRTATLDAEGRAAVAAVLGDAERRISHVEAKAEERLARGGGRGASATIVLASLRASGGVKKTKARRKKRNRGRASS